MAFALFAVSLLPQNAQAQCYTFQETPDGAGSYATLTLNLTNIPAPSTDLLFVGYSYDLKGLSGNTVTVTTGGLNYTYSQFYRFTIMIVEPGILSIEILAANSFSAHLRIQGYTGSAFANGLPSTLPDVSQWPGGSLILYNPTAQGIVTAITSSCGAANPLNFMPVTPCRVADTRNANGDFGGPFLAAASTRSFTIPASACNIPATAAAYFLNVAVIPHGPLGYLTSWATGQTQPLVATLNSADGRVKSTAAIVPAGTNGAASFYATNDTDLVLDINGYFVPSSSNTGLNYYVLNPCRVADTRNAAGSFGGPLLTASQERDIPVQQSSCGVPPEAQAYSVNLATVPVAGGLGYLTIWPVGDSQPTVASLNAPTGAVTSNAALLPAGSGGDIALLASNNTQAIIDINGYFAPPGSSGLHLYIVLPCRVLDTRTAGAGLPFTGTLAVTLSGQCGVLFTASAVIVNATVVPTGPLGYLTLWSSDEPQPAVTTLNAGDGAITSNMAIVPSMYGAINAFASNPTQLIVDVAGYFAP